jgi:hypothetical protein
MRQRSLYEILEEHEIAIKNTQARFARITSGNFDHGALSGLSDDDHSQYLLVSGTREMTGSLDLGGFNILDTGQASVDNLYLIDQGTNPSVSSGPSSYPEGYSFNILSSATGWPITTGTVETFRYQESRAWQIVRAKSGFISYIRYWASSTTWSNWILTAARVHGGATGSSYTLTATNTFETAYTLTITDYPTSNFQARVNAHGSCSAVYSGATYLARMDLQISLDGGSTWAGSGGPRQSGNSGWNVALSSGYARSGPVTGSIQARIRGYASQLATYDELSITMTVSGA